METDSLLGREREYAEVHRFIEERLLLVHCKALFVFGACGCGKTSTILRVMRRVTHRPMACDKAVGRASCGSSSSNSNNSSGGNSPATTAKGRQAAKRRREHESETENNNNDGAAAAAATAEGRMSVGSAAPLPNPLVKGRRVQCHYVNCADMTAQQLCDAVASSVRVAQPRPDAHTRLLLGQIEALPQQV
ncbi:hypothetical protein DQ04_02571000, partial [Trypanosoma grayi]|uniref:hypothetical protein n=1 Tax=Trypanosoma grayi TaxID=71804 RepID=UPI0004F44F41